MFQKNLNMKIILFISTLLTVFSVQSYNSSAKPAIRALNTYTDTVDLGITYRKSNVNIPLRAYFELTNDGTNKLKQVNGIQSSVIFSIDGGTNQTFLQFTDDQNTFPKIVDNKKPKDTVFVQYLFAQAIPEVNKKSICLYIAGLLNENDKPVVQDTFVIVARKTDKFVGSYEDDIKFDSVYIGNQFSISQNWYVRNVWTTPQRIFDDSYTLLSSDLTDQEIIVERLNEDITLAPDQDAIEWEIEYQPLDTKPDTASYKLYFYPFESEGNTDDVDSVEAKITGVGVEQKLDLVRVVTGQLFSVNDGNFTIDLGELRPDEKQLISIVVTNEGNFPIGSKSNGFITNRDDKARVITGIDTSKHLQPTLSNTIDIEFTAGSGGAIDMKYEFESDLLERGIAGAQRKDALFEVYFKGIVKQPRISVNLDSIDFEAVAITNSGDCQTIVEKQIVVKNLGNENLEIYNVLIDDVDNYSVFYSKSVYQPQDTGIITVYFEPDVSGSHEAKLKIITNNKKPNDTTEVKLMGIGVPRAEMKLRIDSVKSFPGTEILVPIIVEKEKISNATTYTDIIRFNRTILEFVEPIYTNTASVSPSLGNKFRPNQDGNLEVKLMRQSEELFAASDTLVILKFNTYLGDYEYSYIDFVDTKVGNRNCEELFTIDKNRGFYQTDSVCGLEFKVFTGNPFVEIYGLSPNPSDGNVKININTPVDMTVDLKLLSQIGTTLWEETNLELKRGENNLSYQFDGLKSGAYHLVLSKDRILDAKQLIIVK